MGLPIYRERQFHFDQNFPSIEKAVFLEGYWQSQNYFIDYQKEIRQDFTLRDAIPERCHSALKEILTSESICVHVRRGDYITNPNAVGFHGTCSPEYYRHAVAKLLSTLANPHCFIFSDDPVWASNALMLPCPSTVVQVNPKTEAHLDLFLMSHCKHFVIANSTFSWWAAWLAMEPSKRVIAPERWFLTATHDTKDLFPNNWEKI
jgi:hypothetical protein